MACSSQNIESRVKNLTNTDSVGVVMVVVRFISSNCRFAFNPLVEVLKLVWSKSRFPQNWEMNKNKARTGPRSAARLCKILKHCNNFIVKNYCLE